jgi:CubicO group peptidase (beta-lactamase class C family)
VADLYDVLHQAAQDAPVPGLAVSVFDRESTLACVVHGTADLTPGRPVDEHTWWDLASLTKLLATLPEVLALIDRGQLDLQRPLAELWPRAATAGAAGPTAAGAAGPAEMPAGAPVGVASLGALLSYDAGLPWWLPFYQTASRREEVVSQALGTPLERAPGSGPVYTDIGFILLGELVADLTGTPLDRLVERRGWLSFQPPAQDCVATELCGWRQRLLVGEVHDENAAALGGVAGHAGAFGTLAGVVGVAQAMFGRRLVAPDLHATAERCWSRGAEGEERFGLGWWLAPTRGIGGPNPGPGSFGGAGYVGNRLWLEPEYGYGVLVLSNRVHPARGDVAPFKEWHGRLLARLGTVLR